MKTQTIFITGATDGIGKYTAIDFANDTPLTSSWKR